MGKEFDYLRDLDLGLKAGDLRPSSSSTRLGLESFEENLKVNISIN